MNVKVLNGGINIYLKRFKPNKYVKCLEDFQYGNRFYGFYKDCTYELQHDLNDDRVYVSPRDYFLIEFCLIEDKFININ